jgi:TonB family protein
MTTATSYAYRRSLFGAKDDLFNRCLTGSAIAGGVFLIAVLLAPIQKQVVTSIEQLPPRFAKLIVDKPKPIVVPDPIASAGPTLKPGLGGDGKTPGEVIQAPKELAPGPVPPPGVRPDPGLAPGPKGSPAPGPGSGPGPAAGTAGRARAQAVVASRLAGTTASLEKTLGGLSSSLQSATPGAAGPTSTGRGRRGRAVRGGRSDGQLGGVSTELSSGASVDLGGSVVSGSLVTIGSLTGTPGGTGLGWGGSGSGGGGVGGGGTGLGGSGGGSGSGGGGYGAGGSGGGGTGGDGSGSTGSAPGVYRSNASLLAVIQKYAAGIQYCYGNELKRQEGLSGKLVVALTVAASGEVIEATIVENTLGSSRLASCALSQIRDWKFPAIERGTTTFQAPFVFTPPR